VYQEVDAPSRGAGIRVLIVDGHLLFAEAVRGALMTMGETIVDIAIGESIGSALTHDPGPDVALVDLDLAGGRGLAIAGNILGRWPHTKVLALTASQDGARARESRDRGLHGYLTKEADLAELNDAVERVMNGERVFPSGPVVAQARTPNERSGALMINGGLTPREMEVLRLLTEGASSGLIAERLHVSPHTVRTHVQGVLTKLQVHSRVEAATHAVRHALVSVGP
jgi:two-component system, NarL family, nitrate/nitrite response regulator NarL